MGNKLFFSLIFYLLCRHNELEQIHTKWVQWIETLDQLDIIIHPPVVYTHSESATNKRKLIEKCLCAERARQGVSAVFNFQSILFSLDMHYKWMPLDLYINHAKSVFFFVDKITAHGAIC